MDSALPLVSVVCVATPDTGRLPNFHSSLFRVLRPLENAYRFEVLYVGTRTSRDALAQMETVAQLDPRVGLVSSEADDVAAAQLFALQRAAGAMVIFLDPSAHPAEILPRLLEKAKSGCAIVNGVPESPPQASAGLLRLRLRAAQRPPAAVLLQREAVNAVMASDNRKRTMAEIALTIPLPRGEINFVPQSHQKPDTRTVRNLLRGSLTAHWHDPLNLVTPFGATVFLIGVFLMFWFPVQSLLAPGTVWFSWCYLIVLLHILGGSILFALGRTLAAARQILERTPQNTQQEDRAAEKAPPQDRRAAAA